MEFLFGLITGVLLWPWWAISIFILICLIDAALVENENAGVGTFLVLVGTFMLVWLAGDVNPFILAWNNFGNIVKFFIIYFIIGGLWSVVKWYLYLLNIRNDMKINDIKNRPTNSYASNNVDKIISWIGHWPFSMIGTVIGDLLSKLTKRIYKFLSSLYDNISNSVFKEFDNR